MKEDEEILRMSNLKMKKILRLLKILHTAILDGNVVIQGFTTETAEETNVAEAELADEAEPEKNQNPLGVWGLGREMFCRSKRQIQRMNRGQQTTENL